MSLLATTAQSTCVSTDKLNFSKHIFSSQPNANSLNLKIAEEIRDASITLPKAIMWSVGVNATLGFLMGVTLIFTLGDIDSLFESVTRQPFIQQFFNATRSYGATNAMTAIVIILLAACCVSEVATASRQIWSFARDRGLPGSRWLSQVSSQSSPPVIDAPSTEHLPSRYRPGGIFPFVPFPSQSW